MFKISWFKRSNSCTKSWLAITSVQPLKLLLFAFFICFTPSLNAQQKVANIKKQPIGLGFKAGYNFAKVIGASSVNAANTSGFQLGAFYSPGSGRSGGLGYRTEIIFSRQGYNFAKGSTTGTVKLDYMLLPQLTTINITRFVQLQLGAQIAFLIHAKADSTTNNSSANTYSRVADFYNKIDYGFAGGIELHPIEGLMLGARLNVSLANANKEQQTGLPTPPFIAVAQGDNIKNNVLQLYAGWRF